MTTEPMFIESPSAVTPHSGSFLWTTPEMYDPVRKRPAFTVQVVAEVFFGMSGPWLRKWQRQANTSPELGTVEPLRTQAKYHSYRLYDIERMAHAFASHQVIDGVHLERVVTMVRTVAQLHGYLPVIQPPTLDPDEELVAGHGKLREAIPPERAEVFHLLHRLMEVSHDEMPGLSCAQYGTHKKNRNCDVLLAQAVAAVMKLERHLGRTEETD